ncbi:big defensin [Tachypleus tridentatus]|uniref:Big defensin n=2 Tax=Tachypleus tridentatus TaxID=6853 RepID=BDEF_TACTR|nr:RecName: Full=Big defensin; Flags: Precursor [Tachypleus tridentatus]
MKGNIGIAVFYMLLLLLPTDSIGKKMEEEQEKLFRQKRNPLIPAIYIGATVGPSVWAYLVALVGAAAVTAANIRRASSDNHSCAGNRGWCRSKCFRHEYVDTYYSAVCGRYFCCRSR